MDNKNVIPNQPLTVSGVAEATGGLAPGNLITTDIDQELFRFNSDDTPLMNLMLKAKKVKVNSPEIDHFMIEEARPTMTTNAAVTSTSSTQVILPLEGKYQNLPREYSTLLVKGVDGYTADGRDVTPGKWLMLFVVGRDTSSNNPVVRAVNGRKTSPEDEFSIVPAIPSGTEIVLLANSLYETQKEVDPDLIVPQPSRIYLQKRGMNQIVSDYFDSQKKRIPFSKAIIAEQAIANFKVRGNRTLWAGRGGKFKVSVPRMGMQYVYCTEGIRWQIRRALHLPGPWTVERVIAMAKMFFTGEDVPKKALLLAGKDLLEKIQCVDFSKHPEIQITTKTNALGWSVTNFHTVFGDIEIKREPTLDSLGWSHSGALLGEDRLVHYVYSQEHSFSDRVEGEEATRSGILIWDALALKGSCHIWIEGDIKESAQGENTYVLWDSKEAPKEADGCDISKFYLAVDCPGISAQAKNGQIWYKDAGKWKLYTGEAAV